MNAVIDCLSNIKMLSYNLLRRYGTFDIETQPLCASFSSLLYDIFHTKEKYIKPDLFKKIIGLLNPLFAEYHDADAKNLTYFFIETLHKELLPSSNIENNIFDLLQEDTNFYDEQKMLNDFFNEYNSNKTIISDIFTGINRSLLRCNNCFISQYSFQSFDLHIFSLKKVKEYKMRKYNNNNLNLNLYDAFECEQEEEKLEGDNMIYCKNCKKLVSSIHKQEIYAMPQILIIILNREKNNQDFNEDIKLDEILDFTNSNIIYNQNNSYKKFYLRGIITHLEEIGNKGHYLAYCRNNFNERFTCYNGIDVSHVSVNDAISNKIPNNNFEKKTPYILFYHYI